jgi:amino acid transporter/mannitol/fructose-specific phosphotransferase system IIA component (Ntr-type)
LKTLERRLGLWSVVAISIGAMLGSGLFVLPAFAVALTGPSVWLAYVVAGLCVMPAALSKAELATAMPVSGGTYVYLDRTFGPLTGTIVGLGLWASLLLKSAFALVGFGAYLHVLAPAPLHVVSLSLLVFVVGLNVLGVRKVGRVQLFVVGIAIAGLVVLGGFSFATFDSARLGQAFASGAGGFVAAVSFVYISYAGVTKVAAIAEEVQNPRRNLPLGILLSLIIVTVLYGAITAALVGNVPMDELLTMHDGGPNLHPIYSLAEHSVGHVAATAVAVLAVATMMSMANAGLLASSRFPFAMARDQLLPDQLAWVSRRFMTPMVSIVLTAAVMAAALLLLDITKIAKLASSIMIAAFMAENLTVIVLRESNAQWYKPGFRAPLYPVLQIVGLLVGAVLLWFLGWLGLIALVGTIIPGVLVFATFGRHRARRRGVFSRLGPRADLGIEAARASSEHRIAAHTEAAVLVSLFGKERSPEMLLEVGGVLAEGGRVQVVHLTDVPEQLYLEAARDEDAMVASLRRRVMNTAAARELEAVFEPVATRDVIETVHRLSSRSECEWLIMEWRGRSAGTITVFNPLGWLINHLSCNLALVKDAGIRHIKQILVYAQPGPHDALVVTTAEHLARIYGAELTFVAFAADDAPAMEVQGQMDYLDQLSDLVSLESGTKLVRGGDAIAAVASISWDFDLLVVGALRDHSLWEYIIGTPEDRLMRQAACSVLRLKTPPGRTHDIGEAKSKRETATSHLAGALDERLVFAGVEVNRKEALFTRLAESLTLAQPEVSAKQFEAALWERERSQNTAVGHGMALPHATVPEAGRSYLGVLTSAQPVDYGAPDGEPVDVVFVTFGPPSERNTHLELLGELSRLVMTTDLLDRIRAAESAAAITAVILECAESLAPSSERS